MKAIKRFNHAHVCPRRETSGGESKRARAHGWKEHCVSEHTLASSLTVQPNLSPLCIAQPNLAKPTWKLIVERPSRASRLLPGHTFRVSSVTAVIGRDRFSDIQLDDPAVARQHLILRGDSNPPTIENLSMNETSFLNEKPLYPGESRVLDDASTIIRIGRTLLRVNKPERSAIAPLLKPRPTQAMVNADPNPFLGIEWVHDRCHVRCKGRLMELFPISARILGLLCGNAASPVHKTELRKLVGPAPQLEQQVTYIRRAFINLVQVGFITQDELREHIRKNSVGAHLKKLDTMSVQDLMRYFIAARRGFGYVLNMATARISVRGEPHYLMLQPGAPSVPLP